MNQCPPCPQVFHRGPFCIFSKICGDISEGMFITGGVNDTGDKLFSDKFIAGVVDTGD
jgi:hypothetical protein